MFFKKRKDVSTASSLDGAHLHYVTEKTEDGELVLGKDGCVALKNEEMIVLCADKIVYRGDARSTRLSDLLSGNGVILQGIDLRSGEEKTLVLYFSYHRK